jgi:hypothetical protein
VLTLSERVRLLFLTFHSIGGAIANQFSYELLTLSCQLGLYLHPA